LKNLLKICFEKLEKEKKKRNAIHLVFGPFRLPWRAARSLPRPPSLSRAEPSRSRRPSIARAFPSPSRR
jgi:hypothetical protein